MSKIALLGYGKMGQTIEKIAKQRGHDIVLKLDTFQEKIDFKEAQVAIDFSMPQAAFHNISEALRQEIPVVSGTTGWLDQYEEAVAICKETNGSFIYASNFSLGVNLFFEINQYVAGLLQNQPYKVSLTETHHTQKLDAPSGTAITLANQILPYTEFKEWSLQHEDKNALPIEALRIENVPGTHEVVYTSEIDDISIKHVAHNREGFALGAVLAAEFIIDKKGVFSMKDVLGIPIK
jgi:4-hydroxy-tetrahydrodipicolinate reductase